MPEKPTEQRRKNEDLREWNKRSSLADKAAGLTAGQSDDDKGYTPAQASAESQRFRSSLGVGGIGGASAATKGKNSAKVEAHMSAWKKARQKAAADKRAKAKAQRNAAQTLEIQKGKNAPNPTPTPDPTLLKDKP